ncbi:helix-turn-helix domain-containing protein [Cardiobacteriaceae bacterium TAE3-ERU3]|nr:helix-turn-helix domain-containing protein [Cardiobacteriaceae bacterium TAE3-ERU3]
MSLNDTRPHESLGQRIKQRRLELNMSLRDLSEKVGMSHTALNTIEKDKVENSRYIIEIADALGVTQQWLLTGSGMKEKQFFSFAPLITMEQAASFTSINDLDLDENTRWFPTVYDYKDQCFALVSEGTSMENPADPHHIPSGSYVIFNAANKNPDSGQLVLAKLDKLDEATFKKLVIEGTNRYLEPLNPRYPIITDDFTIIATAVSLIGML